MKEIINYIRHPYYDLETTKSTRKITYTICIVLLFELIISYTQGILTIKTGWAESVFQNDKGLNASHYLLLQYIIMGIIEELIFRAPLKYKSYILPLFSYILLIAISVPLWHVFGFEKIIRILMTFIIPLFISIPLWLSLRKKKHLMIS